MDAPRLHGHHRGVPVERLRLLLLLLLLHLLHLLLFRLRLIVATNVLQHPLLWHLLLLLRGLGLVLVLPRLLRELRLILLLVVQLLLLLRSSATVGRVLHRKPLARRNEASCPLRAGPDAHHPWHHRPSVVAIG